MKIHRTEPEESKLWQTDAPGIKAMRIILPIAALLSAVSLAGGIASFLGVELTTIIGIGLVLVFAFAAWHFDALAVSSGQSVVRESILAFIRKEIKADVLFWINLAFATLICGAMIFGSFQMSKDGIGYLVLEIRKAKEIRTQTDTTLNSTIHMATDQNSEILATKKAAYKAEETAINTTYDGKIEALESEIQRREKQRTSENYQYIDNKIASLRRQIGEAKAERGEKLAALANTFAQEQSQLLANTQNLQQVVIKDAEEASQRRKRKQEDKDKADQELSQLVAAIFSWSVILMLVIGLRLTMLETRNGILPNPILSNRDLSGPTLLIRNLMALPNYLLSCLQWASEWLYRIAPKQLTPVVDNDLVDFKSAQGKVIAIRKERKSKAKPIAAERREIGFRKTGAGGSKVGSEKLGTAEDLVLEKVGPSEKKLANKGGKISRSGKVGLAKVSSGEQAEMSDEKRALIQQIKLSKKELTKYKKRKASSFQKIEAARREGEQPKHQTLKAYENRSQRVEQLTQKIQQLEEQINSLT